MPREGHEVDISSGEVGLVTPLKQRRSVYEGLGLPQWTNHIAFGASSLDGIETFHKRWVDYGCKVQHIDHGWCEAEEILFDPAPPLKSHFRLIKHED